MLPVSGSPLRAGTARAPGFRPADAPRFSRPGLRRAVVAAVAALALPLLAPAQPAAPLRWIAGGHAGPVRSVSFSPDGQVFASASDDATIKLWSTNGALLQTLSTHPHQATVVTFSSNGSNLAAGTYAGGYRGTYSGLGRVLLWQATGGWSSNVTLLRVLTNHLGRVAALAFSADGLKLASGGIDGSNAVWQISNGAQLTRKAAYNTAIGPAAVTGIAFSPAGLLASSCEDHTLRAWNSSWTQVWNTTTAHSSNVTAVAFSSDGAVLASASLDQTIRIWSAANWLLLDTLVGQTNGVTSISFSPDGNSLAAGDANGFIKLWDLASGTAPTTMAAHAGAVTSLAFSPDGIRLVSGGEDHCVKLWSPPEGGLVQVVSGHAAMINVAAVSPDGALCASAANDRTIQVRRLMDGALVGVLAGHTGCVSAIAFAPDNTALASAGGPLDSTIKLWRLSDGTLQRTIPAGTNGVMALAFSPDGSTLAAGGDFDEQTIRLWNAVDGSLARTLAGHSNGVTALAFSPRGDLLVSGGRRFDHTVKVWNLTNGSLTRIFTGHAHNIESVAVSADGGSVASGSSGANALKLWSTADGSSRDLGTDTNAVFFVAFSPGGGTLASAGRNAINLWNVATGGLSQILTRETFQLTCLAYSPNGNCLVFGREDATLASAANALGALGQPPLQFTRITHDGEGTTELQANVQPWTHYVIQSSSNLTDWSWRIAAVSNTNVLSLADVSTNRAPLGFYRALTPP